MVRYNLISITSIMSANIPCEYRTVQKSRKKEAVGCLFGTRKFRVGRCNCLDLIIVYVFHITEKSTDCWSTFPPRNSSSLSLSLSLLVCVCVYRLDCPWCRQREPYAICHILPLPPPCLVSVFLMRSLAVGVSGGPPPRTRQSFHACQSGRPWRGVSSRMHAD
jgi:hypothetical protein